MKNYIKILLISAFFALPAASTAHADLDGHYSWGEKLGRGVLNIVSSPVEVARTVSVTSKSEGAGYGWTVGLLQGLGRFGVRLGAGVVDIVTCPFEWPKEDREPLIEPEFPWQKWDAEYTTNKV